MLDQRETTLAVHEALAAERARTTADTEAAVVWRVEELRLREEAWQGCDAAFTEH